MQTEMPIENYRTWLEEELEARTKKNPSFSLNSFAKAMQISSASLSQIISGKRPLTRKTALKIIRYCGLSTEQSREFLASALGVGEAKPSQIENFKGEDYEEMEVDSFRLIVDWYHFAILSLGDIKPNYTDPQWISERLGIDEITAKEALDRLFRMGLIRRRGKGFYQSAKPITRPACKCNEVLRRAHSSVLTRAKKAVLEEFAPMEYCSAITMAIDESRLPDARELIKSFRRKLCQIVESGRRERVYTLAIELFPISKK